MSFFNNAATGEMSPPEINELQKALSAGYGTNSAEFTGGRALIPENLETEVMNVVAELKEDCKIMNSAKKVPVKSTVHEVNRRTGQGEYRFLSVPEGGASPNTNQELERITFNMKYLQTRRSVTKQMEAAETFEGALASEKLSGVETVIKGAEYQCFHGDQAVIPTEFDGFIASIKKAKTAERNITSLRANIGTAGEALFENIATTVYEKGGYLDKTLFPPVLAKDIKDLFADRIRFGVQDSKASMPALPDYPTAIGATIKFTGTGAGADKFYHVKGAVVAAGDPAERPPMPASVGASAQTGTSGSKFSDADVGDYKYTVHAVNQSGISAGKSIAAPVTVAKNGSVTLTITPGEGKPATGYIICRSAPDGVVEMEMTQIGDSGEATTVFTDLNEDLPGTASMLFLTERRIQPVYTFGQLLPACTFPLAPAAVAETPFLVLLFGGLELRAPQFCGLVKDIYYKGGLY